MQLCTVMVPGMKEEHSLVLAVQVAVCLMLV
jgi:hypothetical protein